MSRYGGFRKGRKRYRENWNQLKAVHSSRTESVADTPQEFSYSEAQGIWNLRSTVQFPKSNQLAPISLTFIASGTGTDSVSIPASAQAGDVAIFYTAAHGTGILSGDSPVIPAGFTEVRLDIDSSDSIMQSGYAVLQEGYATTLSGINEEQEFCAVMIFRPSRAVNSLATFSVNGQAIISDPSPQTIDMTLAPSYNAIIAVAFMSGTTAVNENIPGSMTLVSANADSHAFYEIFNTGDTLTNLTVDMPDEGDNVMQSWGLAIN